MRFTLKNKRLGLRAAATAIAFVALAAVVPGSAALAAPGRPASKPAVSSAPKPTVVLVHGAWADGSSWDGVTQRLQNDGYTVDVAPNPLRGVASDAAYLADFLKSITGPIVLVGHSYGGFVITNAALGNPNVKALVYIDAFIPAQGDTLGGLSSYSPGSGVTPSVLNFVPSQEGAVVDAYIQQAAFPGIFANDLPASTGAVLAATQEPIAASALAEPSGAPAWTSIPSWDLIGTLDKVLPPATQEFMAARAGSHVVTVPASHLSMISHPQQVEAIIVQAANATS